MKKKASKSKKNICEEEVIEEIPREFDFDGKLIKHVVILNPSKEHAAWERFFNSFPQWMGRENHEFRNDK